MWEEKEWYDWLTLNGGEEMTRQYHPEAFVTGSLEDFF